MASCFLVRSKASPVRGEHAGDVEKKLVAKGLSAQQANSVLTKPIVLKKDLSHKDAMAYAETMTQLGVQVKLERVVAKEAKVEDIYPSVLAQFGQAVARPAMTQAFKSSVLVAMLCALVAPLIYFAVIGLLVLAIWQYYLFIVGHDLGSIYLNILAYAVPGFIGLFLLAFLMSPLFNLGYRDRNIELDKQRYAQLYQLCGKIAQAIGVPAPDSIRVDNEVNASAYGTSINIIRGKLTLTIGMPLVACMSVEQLLGIVAHEYGHFAQRKSMLAYAWINRVSSWLAGCAYGDGAWLATLNKWRDSVDSDLIVMALMACKGLLLAVRSLFRLLFEINLRLTRNMSRQMEYDADQYEVAVVGSKVFVETSKRLHYAAAARSIAESLNEQAYFEHNKLVSNSSFATALVLAAMPKALVEQINQQMRQTQTHFYDTHPADYDRIKRGITANQAGMFSNTRAARLLFKDFERLCRSVTHKQYRDAELLDIKECLTDRPSWLDSPFGEQTELRKAS